MPESRAGPFVERLRGNTIQSQKRICLSGGERYRFLCATLYATRKFDFDEANFLIDTEQKQLIQKAAVLRATTTLSLPSLVHYPRARIDLVLSGDALWERGRRGTGCTRRDLCPMNAIQQQW